MNRKLLRKILASEGFSMKVASISPDAKILNSRIDPRAIIEDSPTIEDSIIKGLVEDTAFVSNSIVSKGARVYGSCKVLAKSNISDQAKVYDRAKITHTDVLDEAQVYGEAVLETCKVSANAMIGGDTKAELSTFMGKCMVLGMTLKGCMVSGKVNLRGGGLLENTEVYGNVRINGCKRIKNSIVMEDAAIKGNVDILDSRIEDDAIISGNVVITKSKISGNTVIGGTSIVEGCTLIGCVIRDAVLNGGTWESLNVTGGVWNSPDEFIYQTSSPQGVAPVVQEEIIPEVVAPPAPPPKRRGRPPKDPNAELKRRGRPPKDPVVEVPRELPPPPAVPVASPPPPPVVPVAPPPPPAVPVAPDQDPLTQKEIRTLMSSVEQNVDLDVDLTSLGVFERFFVSRGFYHPVLKEVVTPLGGQDYRGGDEGARLDPENFGFKVTHVDLDLGRALDNPPSAINRLIYRFPEDGETIEDDRNNPSYSRLSERQWELREEFLDLWDWKGFDYFHTLTATGELLNWITWYEWYKEIPESDIVSNISNVIDSYLPVSFEVDPTRESTVRWVPFRRVQK